MLSEITGSSPCDSRSPQAPSLLAITLHNKLTRSVWLTPPFVSFMLSAIVLQDLLSGKLSECQGLGLKSNSDFKDFFELKLFLVLFF